jgi:quinol monooxygenase YgiN
VDAHGRADYVPPNGEEVHVVLVIGRVRCDPEQRERLVELGREMQEKSRLEDGCLRYSFYTAIEDPLSFVAVEEWRDREALDRHFQQPHLQEFTRGLGEVIAERPEVAIHEVAGTKPIPGEVGHASG